MLIPHPLAGDAYSRPPHKGEVGNATLACERGKSWEEMLLFWGSSPPPLRNFFTSPFSGEVDPSNIGQRLVLTSP